MVSVPLFIIQCDAIIDVLARLRVQSACPAHWIRGVMSLQGD
jgi:hypothetical protein